jgi:hypothetical protein
MLESLASALSSAKQATPALLLGIALASGALLFLPSNVIETLGLTGMVKEHRPYLGAALVLAIALLAAQSVVAAGGLAQALLAKRKAKRAAVVAEQRRLESLAALTPEERAYLLPYVVEEKNTLYFGLDDGVAGGLQAKGIIYRAANVSTTRAAFAFNIQPWAREHLMQNLQLLEGAAVAEGRSPY